MQFIAPFQDLVNQAIQRVEYPQSPQLLYDPIRYFNAIGGKRIRPILTLMAAEMYGLAQEESLPAALAIEIFHNFTLMHDDIMDNAPLRRGKQTVHEKWNPSVAILSGDAMLITAYQQLARCRKDALPGLLDIFNTAAIQVCQGQQLDMDYQELRQIELADYIEMIRLKTAVLLGAALKIGAILAGAPQRDAELLEAFGVHVGIAFQLQDDYLDVYGETATFGKEIGGDILEGKKTFLLLTARQQALSDPKKQQELEYWENQTGRPQEKIKAITTLYNALEVPQLATQAMQQYALKAEGFLDSVALPCEKKQALKSLSESLLIRTI